jgi:hypothetical protein
MIYLLLLLSVSISESDIKDIKRYSPEERKTITIDLIRKKNYETALSFAPDQNLLGCIKFLEGDIYDGIEHIKESAAKGNIFSCDLFILFNLDIEKEELVKYIEKELKIYGDSIFSFESPYLQYLALTSEFPNFKNNYTDSIVEPYFLFKSGTFYSEKHPDKAKIYFEKLVNNYPGSAPAIVARNILRVIEKKNKE